MLSYSTGESGSGADVDKVRTATPCARATPRPRGRRAHPVHAAADVAVGKAKLPGSEVAVARRCSSSPTQYRQQHLQGGAAQLGCRRDRPVLQGSASR